MYYQLLNSSSSSAPSSLSVYAWLQASTICDILTHTETACLSEFLMFSVAYSSLSLSLSVPIFCSLSFSLLLPFIFFLLNYFSLFPCCLCIFYGKDIRMYFLTVTSMRTSLPILRLCSALHGDHILFISAPEHPMNSRIIPKLCKLSKSESWLFQI